MKAYAANYGEDGGQDHGFLFRQIRAFAERPSDIVEIEDGTVAGYSAPGLVALASRAAFPPK